MLYPETVQYLYALGNEVKTVKLGLDRVSLLAEALGHPERRYPVVHVAGTNGKGSTCAMIAAGLQGAGYRTALYTSPHLVEPTERMVIDGRPVSASAFAEAFERVHEVAERMIEEGTLDMHPTYFETVTLMAFDLFAREGVDWAVIEVGLGGRLDATNIVQPRLCAITPVDFDHEAWLGKSIPAIAGEKAGIIKAGVPVVLSTQRPEAREVMLAKAASVGAPVIDAPGFAVEDLERHAFGSRFRVAGLEVSCPLPGVHQVDNARTAALCLRELGVPVDGIGSTVWPGRLERVSGAGVRPVVLLDGAHNPSGARALAAYIEEFWAGRKVGMIFGAMRDKSVEEIAGVLFPLVDELIVTAPDQARALRPEAILELAPHDRARVASRVSEALAMPMDCDVVFVTGSLYLVGEARVMLVQ